MAEIRLRGKDLSGTEFEFMLMRIQKTFPDADLLYIDTDDGLVRIDANSVSVHPDHATQPTLFELPAAEYHCPQCGGDTDKDGALCWDCMPF